MDTQLEKLVKVCERAEARVRRKLLAARARETDCRRIAACADAHLDELHHELHIVNLKIVQSVGVTIHNVQTTEAYLDGLRDDLERVRGDARKAQAALAIAEQERSQLSVRLLSASVKLENARLREAQWFCHRDAISASQQEEFAIESWFLRLR